MLILSGLVIWKPVQFQALGALMGDYEGARYRAFLRDGGLVAFVLVHVVMVSLVPRTFPTDVHRARDEEEPDETTSAWRTSLADQSGAADREHRAAALPAAGL